MSSSSPRVLLLGATGYVGGTVLDFLLQSSNASLKNPISVLLRGEDRAAKLSERYGDRIKAIVFEGQDDTDRIIAIASQHDLVINSGNGYPSTGGESLLRGLEAGFKARGGKGPEPWMISLSGTTNITDRPLLGRSDPKRVFDDANPLDAYEYEKAEDAREPYFPRTAELNIIHAGEKTGVKTVVIEAPLLFGEGRGLFSTRPVAVPSKSIRFCIVSDLIASERKLTFLPPKSGHENRAREGLWCPARRRI